MGRYEVLVYRDGKHWGTDRFTSMGDAAGYGQMVAGLPDDLDLSVTVILSVDGSYVKVWAKG